MVGAVRNLLCFALLSFFIFFLFQMKLKKDFLFVLGLHCFQTKVISILSWTFKNCWKLDFSSWKIFLSDFLIFFFSPLKKLEPKPNLDEASKQIEKVEPKPNNSNSDSESNPNPTEPESNPNPTPTLTQSESNPTPTQPDSTPTQSESNPNPISNSKSQTSLPETLFYTYVLIGTGTSSFSAMRAIRERDPLAHVRIIIEKKKKKSFVGQKSISKKKKWLDFSNWRWTSWSLYETSSF